MANSRGPIISRRIAALSGDDDGDSNNRYSNVQINSESPYLKESLWVRTIIDDLHSSKYDIIAGLALTCSTIYTWWNFISTSFALNKIRGIKSIQISDLRSLLINEENIVVVVRGLVKPEPDWRTMLGVKDTIESEVSGKMFKSVASHILFKPYIDLAGLTWLTHLKLHLRLVPFGVADGKNYVNVDFETNVLPRLRTLPYITIYRDSWFNRINPFLDGVVQEKIVPVGKEISAIGVVYCQDGKYLHIKACDDLPYFVSDLSKDQMVQQLGNKRGILFVGGIVLGSLSVCVLTFTFRRYWRKWKQPRESSN